MPSREEGIPGDSSDASKPAGYPDTEVGVRGEAPTGERPEIPSGEAPTGERPEMPNGEAPAGERPEISGDEAHAGERPEMPDGEQSEMPGEKGGRGGQKNGEKGMKGVNTDEIASAIEALEDEETKANLEALLSDYEAAKSALDEAVKDGSDDVDTYMEAEKSAMEALRIALDEAGIDTRPELPEGADQDSEVGDKPAMGQRSERQTDDSTDTMPEKPAMQQNGNAAHSDNIFARLGNWFKSLFSR